MVASARAVATTDGLINDQYAAPLVRAAGIEFFTRVVDGGLDLAVLGADGGFARLAELSAARSRFFDTFLVDASQAGIRQAVVLASGLDTRAYRLWWPAGITLYEIDQPKVIEFKTAAMRAWGVRPTLDHRAVGVDLRHDWPVALRRVGFDASEPTAWIAEGLFVGFLPSHIQDRLLANVTDLSAVGSRLAADQTVPPNPAQAENERSVVERWQRRGLDIDLAGLIHPGERGGAARYLASRDWATTEFGIAELFAATRLPPLSAGDLAGAPAAIGYLTATHRPSGRQPTMNSA